MAALILKSILGFFINPVSECNIVDAIIMISSTPSKLNCLDQLLTMIRLGHCNHLRTADYFIEFINNRLVFQAYITECA